MIDIIKENIRICDTFSQECDYKGPSYNETAFVKVIAEFDTEMDSGHVLTQCETAVTIAVAVAGIDALWNIDMHLY